MSTKKKIIIIAVCVIAVVLAICGIVALVLKTNGGYKNTNGREESEFFYGGNFRNDLHGTDTLIVFFSWSGHTEELANAISYRTGAKSIILDTIEEYPRDYQECLTLAQNQKRENQRPALQDIEVDLSKYKTIFIGYPIWVEDMPMPIYTFLENNDFSGKTVIPFATSGSSGECGTFEKIRSMLNESTVRDGIHFSEEQINEASFVEEINAWVDALDIKF